MACDRWALTAVELSLKLPNCTIVYEENQGGELVRLALRVFGAKVQIRSVRATKGKRVRAEPVAVLYSLGKIHHIGHLTELEQEQTGWDASNPSLPSPNRLDALVWAVFGLGLCKVRPAYVIENMVDNARSY